MAGLLAEGRSAEVEPVIVAAASRSRGIGGALVRCALEEARRRRAVYVRVRPVARNAEALAAFHALGFRTVGHVELFLDLEDRGVEWRPGLRLHDRDYRL